MKAHIVGTEYPKQEDPKRSKEKHSTRWLERQTTSMIDSYYGRDYREFEIPTVFSGNTQEKE